MGYYGVAIAGLIVLTLKNTFFIPWYATKVLGISTNTFIRSMLPGIVVTILIGAAAGILGALIPFGAVVTFIVVSVVVTITFFVGVWSFGLNSFERGLFASYLPLPIRKRIT